MRKPVMISSKIKSDPCSRVMARRCSRNPGWGGTTPMLPATGSTITAAISPGWAWKASRMAARSLYGTDTVWEADAAGTPGESG